MKKLSAFALFFPFVLLGCGSSAGEEITETPTSSVAFEGAPEARFAGHWDTADGRLAYDIKADGTYGSDSLFAIKGQPEAKTHSSGEWRVDGSRMLFKDAAGNVVPYTFELKGDTLVFTSTGTLKGKTVLKKK